MPVIFLHGLAVNADLWDLPEVRGDGFHYRSLAQVLQEAGYDVWLVNLRGHGAPHMLSEPPPGQSDWCMDHFIVYDLPAVVEHIVAESGRRPFVIGASMGSMTLGGYVQGARLEGAGAQAHIVADAETARARQEKLSGCVFVEFPAALRWPESVYDQRGRLQWRNLLREWGRDRQDVNHPFEVLARWGWLHALLGSAGDVSMSWLGGDESGEAWYRKLPKALGDGLEQIERAALQTMLEKLGTFTGTTDRRADVIFRGRRRVVDSMKAGVLQQMGKCVRAGAFVSVLGAPDHVYSDHYDLIGVPTLVLHGGRDRIANADVTREVFFERIRARDKDFRLYEGLAHGEIEAAPVGVERVYPDILAWLEARKAQSE